MFASSHVSYYGQPIGLIVASDRGAAYGAVYAVDVTYTNVKDPILTIDAAFDNGNETTMPGFDYVVGDVQSIKNVDILT